VGRADPENGEKEMVMLSVNYDAPAHFIMQEMAASKA
jgi:hypothetical protein